MISFRFCGDNLTYSVFAIARVEVHFLLVEFIVAHIAGGPSLAI
jgi:hypothetical protein